MIHREKGRLKAARAIQQMRKTYPHRLASVSQAFLTMELHTLCSLPPPAQATQHQAPILPPRSELSSGRYCGTRQSRYRCRCFLMQGARLWRGVRTGLRYTRVGSVLVGLKAGSLEAISCHWPRGTACCRYAIAARQCASMEGRPNAGPQTWSSSMAC